jgi:transcriptional regulator with XRE-family HTH domain
MYVESLTSYLTRLAQAHSVTVTRLLIDEIAPLLEKAHGILPHGLCTHYTANVNGMRPHTQATIAALEHLTHRRGLQYLTFLPWVNVLCPTQLLRAKRAWCAACFAVWDAAGHTVYEPLLWTLRVLTLCPVHGQPLCSICSACQGQSAPLASCMRPGYCAHCRRWLGQAPTGDEDEASKVPASAWHQQQRVAEAIGALLAGAPSCPSPAVLATAVSNLHRGIQQATFGSVRLFAERVGLPLALLQRLLRGHSLPRLEHVVAISTTLRVSVLHFLTEASELRTPGGQDALDKLRQHHAKMTSHRRSPLPWHTVEAELLDTLQEMPPPTLKEVTRRTGYSVSKLQYHYPHLCIQITTRHHEHFGGRVRTDVIAAAFKAALTEEPPPSVLSVLRRLGSPNTRYDENTRLRALGKQVAARSMRYRRKPFDAEAVQRQLQAALLEEPPPSLATVIKRLGHSVGPVRRAYPDHLARIVDRYRVHRHTRVAANQRALWEEVSHAVGSLVREGVYPAEWRVRQRLSKAIKFTRLAAALKAARRECGLES